MRVKGISNVLNDVAAAGTRKEKIDILQANDHPGLRAFLLGVVFNESLEWVLPPDPPPYTPNPHLDCEGVLYNEIKRLYLFHKGGNDHIHPRKREVLFINLLESVTPGDAELLLAVKDKKYRCKGLNRKLCEDAFQ